MLIGFGGDGVVGGGYSRGVWCEVVCVHNGIGWFGISPAFAVVSKVPEHEKRTHLLCVPFWAPREPYKEHFQRAPFSGRISVKSLFEILGFRMDKQPKLREMDYFRCGWCGVVMVGCEKANRVNEATDAKA